MPTPSRIHARLLTLGLLGARAASVHAADPVKVTGGAVEGTVGSNRFGAAHAVDIEYAFNTLDSKKAEWQPEDRKTAETMARAFANFVRTGTPNGPGVPDWPEFGKTHQVMHIDAVSAVRPEEGRARYELLDAAATAPSNRASTGHRYAGDAQARSSAFARRSGLTRVDCTDRRPGSGCPVDAAVPATSLGPRSSS